MMNSGTLGFETKNSMEVRELNYKKKVVEH